MKITMTETVATVTNCYLNGKAYEVPAGEALPLIRGGQATSDDPAAAEAVKFRRATLDKIASTPMEKPGKPRAPGPVADLHPAEQPNQTPADIERAGLTRGPVETVPPTNPAALDADNPLVPKGTTAAVVKPAAAKAK